MENKYSSLLVIYLKACIALLLVVSLLTIKSNSLLVILVPILFMSILAVDVIDNDVQDSE